MKKELTRIAPLRAGIVLGVLYGILGLVVMTPLFLLTGLFAHKTDDPNPFSGAMGMGIAFAVPFFYAILGFIGGIIMAAVYNLIAGWTGGIQVEVRDVPPVE
jgi:hypothetical protein